MKGALLGFIAAVLVHAAILLFGGVLFFTSKEAEARGPVREVALFSEAEQAAEEAKRNDKPEEKKDLETKPVEELKQDEERPPDMKQVFEAEEPSQGSPTDSVARLDAMSLSALESALSGGGGGDGGFAVSGSLASGGRIGGTGAPGSSGVGGGDGGDLSGAFDVSELDQRARPVFQSAPIYPSDLRQKKIEGIVTVLFIVDAQGKVLNPKVEKSDHEGFERPALEAVKQWRFDAAMRGGEKVSSKVRIPIRFALNN